MRKYLALILAAMTGFAMAEAPKLSGSIDDTTESVAPGFHNPQKDVGNIPTTFPFQPPLVPHSIRGLQVSKNVNQCLACHAVEPSKVTGATPLPKSHFTNRDGKALQTESPSRYFCLQCHVQQTNVNPIVQNKFESVRQTQGK
ncbi:nitrate reductase cytochrome c-type subunit [Mannheimia bovis]|uniref:Periplasmic nitrate reductase, electron transfer subunit n=1 Tax=Mannheimia indoligenes TaxID=3103145 RepID=A0ABU7ZGI9_9PAST|nr:MULTISPECIES: nitrate reductase cytochrome c-type subunit [Mannheimia]AHG74279.1 cytochrome c-type protein [Mannheimia sp. USDA-ARS-USMARC-1261]QLB17454.1 nitrate reductase [Mannheimia varigena]TLU74864.1 nitrate reductase cytochrome c-type subunit [Mannheimia varigena]WHP47763.1 nitrate reductase cytochrome c-type subunit [Mannheimia bovis]